MTGRSTTTSVIRRASSRGRSMLASLALGFAALAPSAAGGQWVRVSEQHYLPADHNWVFRTHYPAADRLFNAFDYGHAILYEVLWTEPDAPVSRLEEREYDFIVGTLLANPPRLPLPEEAIEPHYARLVPEAKAMFEWAHVLHRQIYDVLADERLDDAGRDAAVAEVMRYYRSRPDLAFSARPKSMELMEGQPYSLAFRREYPKFNGLIWAYHWLQVGLYEPLLRGGSAAERQTGVLAAVARFRQMLENPPTAMPKVMPMTAAVAPAFAARYPDAAIVFDNLHGMHDVISDILANPDVPRDRKRAGILLAAERYRDDTSYVTGVEEWKAMAEGMGVDAQGGRATGFLPPAATVGATAAGHDAHDIPDSAFARLQERGRVAMGVDQYTSRHVFEALPDGGRIVLTRDAADTAGVTTIRAHMRDIAEAFSKGDFSTPFGVHAGEVPGTRVMAARRAHIRYEPRDVPGGGELRIITTDPDALRAVHEFLAFQRKDHRAH
ncbi:MAG TPA: hypothetical protein VGE02_04010 [Gemmatimonadales bacterium]